MTRFGQIVICVLVVAASYGAIRWIQATEPTAQRVGAVKETAMLVDVVTAERGDPVPEIVVVGTVEAEREVMLKPRISGTVIERAKRFVPGGFVEENGPLLKLDPTDYETAKRARKGEYDVAKAQHDGAAAEVRRIRAELEQVRAEQKQARAELLQAEADLQVEEGRRVVAGRDYELLDEKLDEPQRRLALREPQLAAARARIEAVRGKIAGTQASFLATEARIAAAEAAVAAAKGRMDVAQAAIDQAENDFKRTTITAPFDAHVLRRMADKGSEVTASVEVAHLVGIEEYWIVASVPVTKLRWIRFPEGKKPGSTVHVHHETAWGRGRKRVGHVKSLIGTLDRTTRLARVLVAVKDPLARKPDPEHPDRPKLIVGALVEVRIQGEVLPQVIRIDRGHLRQDNTVWVKKDGKLDIRPVEVVFEDPGHAFISAGLEAGEQIVTTNLATVKAGSPLRTKAAAAEGPTKAGNP